MSGADIRLTASELDVLEELVSTGHIYAYFLYISAFRRRMDFTTRCVGLTEQSTVSRQWCLWLLERQGRQGSHFGKKKRHPSFVKRQVQFLREAGLLADIPREFSALKSTQKMQFFLPFAFAGLLRAEEERPGERPHERPDERPPLNPVAHESEMPTVVDVEDDFAGRSSVDNFTGEVRQSDRMSDRMSDPLLVLNRNIKNKTNINDARDAVDNFETIETPDFSFQRRVGDGGVIPHDWQPSEAAIEFVQFRTSWTRQGLALELPFFVMYWREREEVKPSWDEVYKWYYSKQRFPNSPGVLRG